MNNILVIQVTLNSSKPSVNINSVLKPIAENNENSRSIFTWENTHLVQLHQF